MTASMLLSDVLIPDSGLYSPAILIPAFICLQPFPPSPLTATQTQVLYWPLIGHSHPVLASHWSVEVPSLDPTFPHQSHY